MHIKPLNLRNIHATRDRFLRTVQRHLDAAATLTETEQFERYTLTFCDFTATVRISNGCVHFEAPFIEDLPMPKNRRGRDVILAMNEMFRATRSAAAMAVEVSSLEAARRILAGKAEEKEAALLQAQRRARTAFDQKTFDGIVATMGVVNVRVVAGETYARVEGVSPIDPQQAVRVVEYLMTHVTLSSARDTLLALIAGGAIKQS